MSLFKDERILRMLNIVTQCDDLKNLILQFDGFRHFNMCQEEEQDVVSWSSEPIACVNIYHSNSKTFVHVYLCDILTCTIKLNRCIWLRNDSLRTCFPSDFSSLINWIETDLNQQEEVLCCFRTYSHGRTNLKTADIVTLNFRFHPSFRAVVYKEIEKDLFGKMTKETLLLFPENWFDNPDVLSIQQKILNITLFWKDQNANFEHE